MKLTGVKLRLFSIMIALSFFTYLAACSHELEIRNLNEYQPFHLNSFDHPISIGIISSTGDMASEYLLEGIIMQLAKEAEVLMPFYPQDSPPVDVVAKIHIRTSYKGSWVNFLNDWPGFLFFAPSRNGYRYKVKYEVGVSLVRPYSNEEIDSFFMPVDLKIKHADINRTWTQVSCILIDLTLTACIGGINHTKYDNKVTSKVAVRVQEPIGEYIAQEITWRINNVFFQYPFPDAEERKVTTSHTNIEDACRKIADQFASYYGIGQAEGETPSIKIAIPGIMNPDGEKTALGNLIMETITTYLVQSGDLNVIERRLLDKVLYEFELLDSGHIDTDAAREVGNVLGADALVLGTVTKVGNNFIVNVRLVDTLTGSIQNAASVSFYCSPDFIRLYETKPKD